MPTKRLTGMVYHEVDTVQILGYCRSDDGTGDASELHLVIRSRDLSHPLVLRYTSADAVDALIEALQKYRSAIWPPRPIAGR